MNKSNTFCDYSYENDDSFAFRLDLKTFKLHYSQFVKYSKYIRDKFLFLDVVNMLPQMLTNFQKEFQISTDNILYFFSNFYAKFYYQKKKKKKKTTINHTFNVLNF